MTSFQLHDRLAADTFLVGDLGLSRVLLLNDVRYPWLILVPRVLDVTEIHHLSEINQQRLITESCQVAKVMDTLFEFDKMNLGALGNLVPQLHLHHVARSITDPAWPGPVWGHSPAQAYGEDNKNRVLAKLRTALALPQHT